MRILKAEGNKQTNTNLPNDNDSAASLVQLQLSNIFSLGYLPTYLPLSKLLNFAILAYILCLCSLCQD